MICHGFKGGVGTSSRRVHLPCGDYTLGVQVQANHGDRERLVVNGVPIGRRIPDAEVPVPPDAGTSGSIITVVATDVPLLPHQCRRVAQRVGLAIGRLGGLGEDGSGDMTIAFSTANRGRLPGGANEAGPPLATGMEAARRRGDRRGVRRHGRGDGGGDPQRPPGGRDHGRSRRHHRVRSAGRALPRGDGARLSGSGRAACGGSATAVASCPPPLTLAYIVSRFVADRRSGDSTKRAARTERHGGGATAEGRGDGRCHRPYSQGGVMASRSESMHPRVLVGVALLILVAAIALAIVLAVAPGKAGADETATPAPTARRRQDRPRHRLDREPRQPQPVRRLRTHVLLHLLAQLRPPRALRPRDARTRARHRRELGRLGRRQDLDLPHPPRGEVAGRRGLSPPTTWSSRSTT